MIGHSLTRIPCAVAFTESLNGQVKFVPRNAHHDRYSLAARFAFAIAAYMPTSRTYLLDYPRSSCLSGKEHWKVRISGKTSMRRFPQHNM